MAYIMISGHDGAKNHSFQLWIIISPRDSINFCFPDLYQHLFYW